MSNSLKLLLVVPTLNEGGNIKRLFLKIKNNVKFYDLLFIDDNSSDDTLREINFLKKKNKNIFLIKRPLKLGIGSAHKEGIKFAFKKKYKILVTMDADGTHHPKFIKHMLKKINSCSLVTTNRFLNKDSLKGWSFFRRALTYLRYVVINFLFSINYDTSGAFRIYDLNKIKLRDILLAKNNSYSFFWESIYFLNKKNYKIKEISINLPSRVIGNSKLNTIEIIRALIYMLKVFIIFRVFCKKI